MQPAQPRCFDVAVVGAGPAGSATARGLARRGLRVALLERTRFESPRIGESLAPNVREPLVELGLWQRFMALGPLPSWGTRSLWGGDEPQAHSHIVSPYGCGWHVDRRAFDQMLARGAAQAGAVLYAGVVTRPSRDGDRRWSLRLEAAPGDDAQAPRSLRARVLVDGTGRSAQLGRALGARRVAFDHLVGVSVRFRDVDPQQLGHLLVEAVGEGWWYSAPLPQTAAAEGMLAMLMTDADLCARQRLAATERFRDCLMSAAATSARLASSRWLAAPSVCSAQSQRVLRGESALAPAWLAVGDATLAVDPISGSGVLRALHTARAAVDTILGLLERPHDSRALLGAYEQDRNRECSTYLLERAQYYAAEQRFATPFWQRRQVLPT